jgi:RimJ/RimL family protein N-acetyltransferase
MCILLLYGAVHLMRTTRKMDLKHLTKIRFVRLSEVSLQDIVLHMNDPRVAEHMPLLTFEWTPKEAQKFVTTKEKTWQQDGLGHWAILSNEAYVGWGGFQKEGEDWDFGLVLKPDNFGLGMRVSRAAIEFAKADPRIESITFLLPLSRKKLGALSRGGAQFVGNIEYGGEVFKKYRLETG